MHDTVNETAKGNNDMISISDGDLSHLRLKRTLAHKCKECNAIPHSEFEAEWMRQLELRYKNMDNQSQSNHQES